MSVPRFELTISNNFSIGRVVLYHGCIELSPIVIVNSIPLHPHFIMVFLLLVRCSLNMMNFYFTAIDVVNTFLYPIDACLTHSFCFCLSEC